VGVLGAGRWGSVLAGLLARNGVPVRLWVRSAEAAHVWRTTRQDSRGTSGDWRLPSSVVVTSNMLEATREAAAVVVAVPSVALPDVYHQIEVAGIHPRGWVSTAKGIMDAQLTTPHAWLAARTSAPVAVLSGPNLAHEIAADLPAATTVASRDAAFAETVRLWFHQATFRVYVSSDPQGVEVGGAEMVRLGRRLGGEAATLYGLAGVGDLVATCLAVESRNHQAGRRLAAGESGNAILESGLTAEGLRSVKALAAHGREEDLDLPIAEHVHGVAFGSLTPSDAVASLMARHAVRES
jgi:glycerol-3-phosphate dehydrogenase (NAD(P)+)